MVSAQRDEYLDLNRPRVTFFLLIIHNIFPLCQIFRPNLDIIFWFFENCLNALLLFDVWGPRVSEHTPHVCKCLQKSEEGIRFLGTGTPDGCQPPWECWELNPGFQQKQQELTVPKSSFQPQSFFPIYAYNC